MELNMESTDRSYLFGRILAVEDAIEQTVLDRKKNGSDSNRETNARRLWNAYVNHPMTTWQELKNLLLPYEAQLPAGSRVFYQKTTRSTVPSGVLSSEKRIEAGEEERKNCWIGAGEQNNYG